MKEGIKISLLFFFFGFCKKCTQLNAVGQFWEEVNKQGVGEMQTQREESVPKLRFCLPSFITEQNLALKENLLGDRV